MTNEPLARIGDVAGSDDDRRRGVARERAGDAASDGVGNTGIGVLAGSDGREERSSTGQLAGGGAAGNWVSVGEAAVRAINVNGIEVVE